jgi:hypothetical protein
VKVQKLLCFLDIAYRSTERIWNAVTFISTVLGAGLLHGTIPNPYFVTSHKAKLGLVMMYTIAFAFMCGTLDKRERSGICSTRAAYVAVIVVFGSSDSGNSTRATCQVPRVGAPVDWGGLLRILVDTTKNRSFHNA